MSKIIKYPSINLPHPFVELLKANLNTSENIREFFNSNQSLMSLLQQSFGQVSDKLDFSSIMKSYGWTGIRNQLAASYFGYVLDGVYPRVPDLSLVKDLLEFEDQLKAYTVAGFSRSFMLAFYFKTAKLKANDKSVSIDEVNLAREMIELLKKNKTRIVQIDWLILTLNHLEVFFGRPYLLEEIKKGTPYEKFYQQLDDGQKEMLTDNMLSYGSSINEKGMFYPESV